MRSIGRSISNFLMKGLFFLVIAGMLLAFARHFNWDLFGIVDWLWTVLSGIVIKISEIFSDNPLFREGVSAPS